MQITIFSNEKRKWIKRLIIHDFKIIEYNIFDKSGLNQPTPKNCKNQIILTPPHLFKHSKSIAFVLLFH